MSVILVFGWREASGQVFNGVSPVLTDGVTT